MARFIANIKIGIGGQKVPKRFLGDRLIDKLGCTATQNKLPTRLTTLTHYWNNYLYYLLSTTVAIIYHIQPPDSLDKP